MSQVGDTKQQDNIIENVSSTTNLPKSVPVKILKEQQEQEDGTFLPSSPKLNTKGVLSVKIPFRGDINSPKTIANNNINFNVLSSSNESTNVENQIDSISSNEIAENHFIFLPHHNEPFNHFALDIGGSLVKMVYLIPFDSESEMIYHAKDNESNEMEAFYHNHSSSSSGSEGSGSEEESDDDTFIHSLPPQSPLIISETNNVFDNVDNEDEEDRFRLRSSKKGSKLCFARFKTADMEECLSLIEKLISHSTTSISSINATGGGAYKFSSLLKNRFGIEVNKLDEMDSLIKGLNFLLKNIPNESFRFKDKQREYCSFQECKGNDLFPYLLVNIGSGVSILRVDGIGEYERVSGSSIGGGTFWGLCKVLTKCSSFEEILELTKTGDNKRVDMLVGDIYGRDYGKIGLSSDTIASSFGKLIMSKTGEEKTLPTDADLAKSLLFMICNNIGQIAYLNALRFNLKRIFFAGYFIRNHDVTMNYISYAVNFWSRGEIQAMFLKHEGYLGAIGSFLSPTIPRENNENHDTSSNNSTHTTLDETINY
ncbi:hypothetical protein ABK040_002112 [Willaertia magna]